MKQIISLNLDERIVNLLKGKAKDSGRSLSNYVNEHFKTHLHLVIEADHEEEGVVEL